MIWSMLQRCVEQSSLARPDGAAGRQRPRQEAFPNNLVRLSISAMPMQLHDLAGADPSQRFSPYCWRARLALAHKGFVPETLPWRFSDKAAIADASSDKVPVLRDGGQVIADSWRIAEYLEDTYPDRPSLFGGEGGRVLARFINAWADATVLAGIATLIVADIPAILAPQDLAYFVTSREARFGRSLLEVVAGRDARVVQFRQTSHPARMILRERAFLHGDGPAYADYILFGGFQWARCASPFPILLADDPLYAWRERMLDLFGGLARNVPAV
jgi:glutathione S-transferase